MLIFQQVLYRFLLDINLTTPEGCSSTSLLAASEEDCTLPDLNTPHLRPFFKPIYTLVLTIVLYSILILIGVTGNYGRNIDFEKLNTIIFHLETHTYYISYYFKAIQRSTLQLFENDFIREVILKHAF